jgi:hypothetical protein
MLTSLVILAMSAALGAPPDAPDDAREARAEYNACHLQGQLSEQVFLAAYRRAERQGPLPRVLAIADMSQPSTAQRLYVVDLRTNRLLLRTWVAHGKGSGEDRCVRVSNRPGSLCTSAGLLRIGERIVSPKHGDALLLHGLDRGLNDRAEFREIIIHGASYVSDRFIRAEGRLGRSWGCPAVAPEVMAQLLHLLPTGSLLYIHIG